MYSYVHYPAQKIEIRGTALSHEFFGWARHAHNHKTILIAPFKSTVALYIPLQHNLEEAIEILFGTTEWSNTS